MILTMYVASEDGPQNDERVLAIAIEESLIAAGLGFNPWFHRASLPRSVA